MSWLLTSVCCDCVFVCLVDCFFGCSVWQTLHMPNCAIQAQIWDTAGQERYDAMTQAFFRDAVGAFLVYDVHCRESFENLQRWMRLLREYGHPYMLLSLLGNKIDIPDGDDRVTTKEAAAFAAAHSMDFMETSATTGAGVETAFRRLILSVARILPEVKATQHNNPLPDGWVQLPRSQASDHALDSPDDEVDVQYQNYWTGEATTTWPTAPAPQGQILAGTYADRSLHGHELSQYRKNSMKLHDGQENAPECQSCILL